MRLHLRNTVISCSGKALLGCDCAATDDRGCLPRSGRSRDVLSSRCFAFERSFAAKVSTVLYPTIPSTREHERIALDQDGRRCHPNNGDTCHIRQRH
jgi:hypothetical protein